MLQKINDRRLPLLKRAYLAGLYQGGNSADTFLAAHNGRSEYAPQLTGGIVRAVRAVCKEFPVRDHLQRLGGDNVSYHGIDAYVGASALIAKCVDNPVEIVVHHNHVHIQHPFERMGKTDNLLLVRQQGNLPLRTAVLPVHRGTFLSLHAMGAAGGSALLRQDEELVNPLDDGSQALLPEIPSGHVDAGQSGRILHRGNRCRAEKRPVSLCKAFPLLLIAGVKSAGQQRAKGVWEVVKAQCRVVVVDLVDPHIGMEALRVKTIPIGRRLCAGHQLAQPLGQKEALFPLMKHRPFKEKPGVDVADNLRIILEPLLQKMQPWYSPIFLPAPVTAYLQSGAGCRCPPESC